MKRPVVDYREFRFSKLNTPEFSHLKYLGGWIFYFTFYFLTEMLIPQSACHEIHCALDDLIPFNEYFAVFYVFWYFLVFGVLAYYLLYDIPQFKKLQTFLICTQVMAMTVYILYPSVQHLRPEYFVNDNVFTHMMGFIYSIDTPTGVCPSLHVGYSLGILSVVSKDRKVKPAVKFLLTALVILICMSVCFVKQHSAVDVFMASIMCVAAELFTYGREYYAIIRKELMKL